MYKIIVLCLFLFGLILGWAVDAQLSVPEKITKAFPPSSEVRIAFENLESLAQTKEVSSESFKARYSELLTIKALSCSRNLNIGRFDSIRKVKTLAIDTNCLAFEDSKLLQYLGLNQVGIQISRPALRDQAPLGKKTLLQQPPGWTTSSAIFSSKSGVAVLANGNVSGEFISYDIKAGRKITKLESIYNADVNKMSLSPNGRVAAIPTNRGEMSETVFLDTETGSILARLDKTIGVRVWLPNTSAALLKRSTNNTLLLANFKNGKTEGYELDSVAQNWALPIGDSSSRVLVGTYKAFYLVKFEGLGSGIKSTIVKDFYPQRGTFITYSEPILMLNNQVAIFNFNDLFQYDLDTGKETRIETYLYLSNGYKKFDEETFLVKAPNNIDLGEVILFNIKDKTFSHINEDFEHSVPSALNGRNGFMLRKSDQLWVGEHLDADQSQTLQMLLAEKQAKLAAEKAKDEKEIALFGMPVDDEPRPENPMLIRRDPITGEMVQDAYGRPVTKNNLAQAQPIKSKFFISKIPANTKFEFIGVNDSVNKVSHEISVTVQKSDRPILLILSSCSMVKWKITKLPGSRLLGVFQQTKYSGQPFSSVDLDNTEYSTQILTRLNYCAFVKDSTEYKVLESEIFNDSGKNIEKFQGAISGFAFTAGN